MDIHVQTLFFLFAASNLFVVVFLGAYLRMYRLYHGVLQVFLMAKLLGVAMLVLFAYRENFPAWIAIGLANALFFFAFIYELFCIIYAQKIFDRVQFVRANAIALLASLTLILFSWSPDNIRAFIASVLISSIYCLAGLILAVRIQRSKIQSLSMFLAFSVTVLFVIRAYWALGIDTSLTAYTANLLQVVSYILLFLISNAWSLVLLLILKEQDEAIIREDNLELKRLNTDKNTFFSIIAHDLRSPISQLSQIGEQLWLRKDSLNSTLRDQYIQALHKSTKRTFNLLDNLLQWARSNSGNINYTPQKIKLKTLIDDVCSIYQTIADEKNILISNTVKEHVIVIADKDMLRTVIRNLLSNAIKFSLPSGIIKIISSPEDGYQVTGIIDNGIGMSAENLDKLRSDSIPFSTRGTANEPGTGLGFKLCKDFIEQNKGTISIESTPNQGTRIWFGLPAYTD